LCRYLFTDTTERSNTWFTKSINITKCIIPYSICFQLYATAYTIYSQLPSISEAVPPSANWGRTMPWWQGPHKHVTPFTHHNFNKQPEHIPWPKQLLKKSCHWTNYLWLRSIKNCPPPKKKLVFCAFLKARLSLTDVDIPITHFANKSSPRTFGISTRLISLSCHCAITARGQGRLILDVTGRSLNDVLNMLWSRYVKH
jgi:hypothetical protein